MSNDLTTQLISKWLKLLGTPSHLLAAVFRRGGRLKLLSVVLAVVPGTARHHAPISDATHSLFHPMTIQRVAVALLLCNYYRHGC